MTDLSLLSAFLIGLAGGVHCVGMCGGIVAALRAVTPTHSSALPYTLAYNSGRIASYTFAGALAGALGQTAVNLVPLSSKALSILSAIMLILLAFYLGNWWKGLVHVENIGRKLFTRIQPLSKRFLPFSSPLSAFPYGFIWGWLPCGLVYSTLTWSIASGDVLKGAALMLAFGLGTLPTLILASEGSQYILKGIQHPIVRQCIAISLSVYGVFLMLKVFDTIPI